MRFRLNLIFSISLALTIIYTHKPVFAEHLKQSFESKISALETSTGGQIGIYAHNLNNDKIIAHRANERFPMGCTSKVMGVAAILKQSMVDPDLLDKKVTYSEDDLVMWSPVTKNQLSSGMTIRELCDASIRYSDNTAMNLLVNQLGGLGKINEFARSINNLSFRQDHDWPKEAYSGGVNNLKDSATPQDMADSLHQLAFTQILDKPQRESLVTWLKENTTGAKRIRKGIPSHWIVGDKTGTGGAYGTTNDIAIVWPSSCKPFILAIYYTSQDQQAQTRNDVVADVTKLVVQEMSHHDNCLVDALNQHHYS